VSTIIILELAVSTLIILELAVSTQLHYKPVIKLSTKDGDQYMKSKGLQGFIYKRI
jgi:hypothetical protein